MKLQPISPEDERRDLVAVEVAREYEHERPEAARHARGPECPERSAQPGHGNSAASRAPVISALGMKPRAPLRRISMSKSLPSWLDVRITAGAPSSEVSCAATSK